jgi:hypothetical protein
MVDYAPALKKLLKEGGCWFDRQGKDDHEIWYSPDTKRKFPVDGQDQIAGHRQRGAKAGRIAEGLLRTWLADATTGQNLA